MMHATPPKRPTAEQVDARHGEIKKHHRKQRKRRAEERPSRPRGVRLAYLRWGELLRLMRHRYGHEMPNSDAARRDLEILLNYANLTNKKPRHVTEIWAPWLPAAEADHLAARRPVLHKKGDLGQKLGLLYCDRQAVRADTIGCVDVDGDGCERLRRQHQNERKRQKRAAAAKQETNTMTTETKPNHDLSRRQAAMLEKLDGAEIATSNLMEQVRRHRAFRGVATDSLRIIVHRTLDQLLAMGLVADRNDQNPRGGRQIRFVRRQR